MTFFVLSQQLPGNTQKNYENPVNWDLNKSSITAASAFLEVGT
jgi:hypothetical protein